MRYHLDIGKCHKEIIISFIIAKDYFSFPAFTSANNKEYKGFMYQSIPGLTILPQATPGDSHILVAPGVGFLLLCLARGSATGGS